MHCTVKVITTNPIPKATVLDIPVDFKPCESLLVGAARDLANWKVFKFISNDGVPIRERRGGFPSFLVIIFPFNKVAGLKTFGGWNHFKTVDGLNPPLLLLGRGRGLGFALGRTIAVNRVHQFVPQPDGKGP